MGLLLCAHLLPELVEERALAGSTIVVLDVLRASTTITYALAAGARAVIPCLEVDEARRQAASLTDELVVLGGERGGLPIEGFDLGNSPSEFTPTRVAGRTIVFTTTNGTKALLRCRQARRVLIGAFANLSAVAAALCDEPRVDLLCAGTRGEITREDVLFAGCLAEHLIAARSTDAGLELNDQARLAIDAWQAVAARSGRAASAEGYRLPTAADLEAPDLAAALRESQGGRNLVAIGLDRDIVDAAAVDRLCCVPELGLKAWRITAS